MSQAPHLLKEFFSLFSYPWDVSVIIKLGRLNLETNLFFVPFSGVICSLLLERVSVLPNIDGGISFISIVELVDRFSEQLLLNVVVSSFVIFVWFYFWDHSYDKRLFHIVFRTLLWSELFSLKLMVWNWTKLNNWFLFF